MNRPRPLFRPTAETLEGRIALSNIPAVTAVVERVILPGKKTETVDKTTDHIANGTATTTVRHLPQGGMRTSVTTLTTTGPGTSSLSGTTTLANGTVETEAGTNVTQGSPATISSAGIVQANVGSSKIRSMATTFNRTITIPGKGVETISGTEVTQFVHGRKLEVFDQTDTLADGTTDQVHKFTVDYGSHSTTTTTRAIPGQAPTTSSTSSTIVRR